MTLVKAAVALVIAGASFCACCACSEPEPLTLSPQHQPGVRQESCTSRANLFSLVGGDQYVGAIVPKEYFDSYENQPDRFARSLGVRSQGAWTPTVDDVRNAEARLHEVLTEAAQHPESIDVASAKYSQRAVLIRQVLTKIVRDLPKYRRQYAGLVVNGRYQLLCKFFLPDDILGPGWLCGLLTGVDWDERLWQIRYDIQDQSYEGFDFGS